MRLLRSLVWLVPLKLGLAFVAGGLYMVSQGIAARRQVRDALVEEQIISSTEAAIPRALVADPETAAAQAEVIRTHTLHQTEGRTFAQLPHGDPLREHYLQGVTLRTALGMAVMGFKVSDLVVGMGAFMAAVGGAFIFMAPFLRSKRAEDD